MCQYICKYKIKLTKWNFQKISECRHNESKILDKINRLSAECLTVEIFKPWTFKCWKVYDNFMLMFELIWYLLKMKS